MIIPTIYGYIYMCKDHYMRHSSSLPLVAAHHFGLLCMSMRMYVELAFFSFKARLARCVNGQSPSDLPSGDACKAGICDHNVHVYGHPSIAFTHLRVKFVFHCSHV